jgi:aminoglycoside phosphotransferase (APT) family kinase protein
VTTTQLEPPSLAALIEKVGGRAACLALSKDPNAKMTILLFTPGAAHPLYVAKTPTTDAAARSVEREADRLAEVSRLGLGPLRGTVPEVVGMVEHLGRPVLVTTALPGRSMLAAYHSWRHTARPATVADDFAVAGAWLAAMQQRTASGETSAADMLRGVAAAIRRRFGGQPGTEASLTDLAALRARLAGHRTAPTLVHGDFWPGNLLIADGQVRGVIDWEAARTSDLPTRDPARFVLSYSLYLDRHARPGGRVPGHRGLRGGQWGAGVEYAIDGSGWFHDLVSGFLADALQRLGLPRSCWRDVLLAELATIAAEADDPDFAWRHLLLFSRLCRGGHQ